MDPTELMSEVDASFSEGAAALEEKHFTEAIMAFRAGIQLIGDRYLRSGSIDGTSTRVMLAGVRQKQGHLSEAAFLLRTVLATRRSMFETNLADADQRGKGAM